MMLPDIVVTNYTWDQRNRLANAGAVNYRYDYLNRLVSRTGDIFVHDGYQIVLQFTNGVLSHRYFWGANQDELVADEPAISSSTPSTQTLWALCDHLGSVRDLLRLNGTTPVVTNHLTYNAFGSRVGYTSMAAADMTLFRYTGKMTDDTTRLQWNINRWYDAYAGKWISEDPIGFEGDDANLYRYVGNRPTVYIDVAGLYFTEKTLDSLNPFSFLWKYLAPRENLDLTRSWSGVLLQSPTPVFVGARVRGNWAIDITGEVSTSTSSGCIEVGYEAEGRLGLGLVWGALVGPPLKKIDKKSSEKGATKKRTPKERKAERQSNQKAIKRAEDITKGKRGKDKGQTGSTILAPTNKCKCEEKEIITVTSFVQLVAKATAGAYWGGGCNFSARWEEGPISKRSGKCWTGVGVYGAEASISIEGGLIISGTFVYNTENL